MGPCGGSSSISSRLRDCCNFLNMTDIWWPPITCHFYGDSPSRMQTVDLLRACPGHFDLRLENEGWGIRFQQRGWYTFAPAAWNRPTNCHSSPLQPGHRLLQEASLNYPSPSLVSVLGPGLCLKADQRNKKTALCEGQWPIAWMGGSRKYWDWTDKENLIRLWRAQIIFPRWLSGKESSCNTGDLGLIPGMGRSPGEGNGNLLQDSCLDNPRGREAWRATVHRVSKSQTKLSGWTHTSPLKSLDFRIFCTAQRIWPIFYNNFKWSIIYKKIKSWN